jgi:quercetin dioxygenase-like cupin family protein
MKIIHDGQVPATPVNQEGAAGCHIRCLIGPEDGAPSFTMRQFEVAPGGRTPRHAHSHEHEVFVLEGNGTVTGGGQDYPLRPGTAVLVPPNEEHQFRNDGTVPLRFLCLIPHPLGGMTAPCAAACGCE